MEHVEGIETSWSPSDAICGCPTDLKSAPTGFMVTREHLVATTPPKSLNRKFRTGELVYETAPEPVFMND